MTFFQDPRDYQISVLGGLLVYGLFALDFDIGLVQVVLTLGSVLLIQYACTRLWRLPRFDPKSALISGLSLCLLLRTNFLWSRAARRRSSPSAASSCCGAAASTSSTRPTSASSCFMLTTNMVWVSPGQWGNVAFFGFLMACLGGLVVHRALRSDVAMAFALCYAALLFGRSLSLGEPMAIPLHRLQSGGLLLFTFFMISDPRTTPDSRAGRFLFAALVAFGAWYVQFRLFRTNGAVVVARRVLAARRRSSTGCCQAIAISGMHASRKDDGAYDRVWKRLTVPHVTAAPAVLAIAGRRLSALALSAGRAGVLRLLRLEGRYEALQQGLEGRPRPRRRSHGHDDVERLQGRI